jgi:hypothetical protein
VNDFHWTNRKKNIERRIFPGLKVRLQVNYSGDAPILEAAIHGNDQADRPYITAYHPIDKLFDGIDAWAGGKLIQVALPFVNKGDREFIKTGMSPRDWQDTFGEDD